MATAFQSMNVPLGPRDAQGEPAAGGPPMPLGSPIRTESTMQHEEPGRTTPTRTSFIESSNKRSLPISPENATFPPLQGTTSRDNRSSSRQEESRTSNMDDMDIGSEGEEGEGSDAESTEGDGDGRPSKKKKGQRFFCTDYPPCNLSFTRSEHLARHIRKHTGERPFQCHCARRFSRLDNLRQHAQTVHVNEDIPGDSLAATGTRFQRQIRTDRVRPQGRARASTAGSQSSHRGHGRNLSTSSIASTSSNMSTLSNLSQLGYDPGRRQQPLMMAENSPRGRLTIDTSSNSSSSNYPAYGSQSPGNSATTPTYSNTPSSPFNPALGSPVNRHQSWGGSGHNRRLSVPSGANPFQPAPAGIPGGGYHVNPLHAANHSRTSSTNSIMNSPTSSIHSFTRQDPDAEADWRRRTWHPGGYPGYSYQRPATSGLAFHQTPDALRGGFAPQPAVAASQSQRLPGFETFDQISQRPETPPRRPTASNEAGRQPSYPGSGERTTPDRRGHISWDLSVHQTLHQNLTKLDIANGTPPRETAPSWNRRPDGPQHLASNHAPGQVPTPAVQHSHEQVRSPTVSFEQQGEPSAMTSARAKRQGWYHAPPQTLQSTQPPSATDAVIAGGRNSNVAAPMESKHHTTYSNGAAVSPPAANTTSYAFRPAGDGRSIDDRRGYPHSPPHARHPSASGPPPQPYDPTRQGPTPSDQKFNRMTGLEALVAAATGEDKSRADPMHH